VSNAPVIPYLFQNRTNPSGDREENQIGQELQGGHEAESSKETLGSHNNHLNCAQDHSEERNHDYDNDDPQESKSSDDCSHFTELAHLAKNHVSQAIEAQLSSSPAKLENKHSSNMHDLLSKGTNFSSLAQLADRHSKVTKLEASDKDNV
jgi:hypothetical protein